MKQTKRETQSIPERMLMNSPIGTLVISARDGAVCAIGLARPEDKETANEDESQQALRQAVKELDEYFAGTRTSFTFPMRAEGTAFQKRVWLRLSAIPFGELRTYGQIAAEVDNPKGSRAVGMACNKNPIMIAVPCHRVVGAGGKLVGFAYGTQMKQQLLEHEKQV